MDQEDIDEFSDSSNDDDFDPNICNATTEEDTDLNSEVEANSGDEGGTKKGRKRKKKSPTKSKRSQKSRKVVNGNGNGKRRKDSDEESDDDEKDEDFIIDPKVLEAEELEKKRRLEEAEAELNKVNAEEEKKKTDILWADFLSSVNKDENSADSRRSSTTTETITYDFAGEKFQVYERINSIPDTIDHQKPTTSTSAAAASNASFFSQFNIFHDTGRKLSSYLSNGNSISDPSRAKQYIPPSRKGISSVLSSNPAAIGLNGKSGNLKTVLNAIRQNKSKKTLGTLEKTKLDWQTFKKSEGIDEELKNHVQSKESYLERQDFLQRTDLRQFEHEKNMRARNRRNNP